jgi:hypothetical protein
MAGGYSHDPARMQRLRGKSPLDPDVADTAPSDSVLTVYDKEHVITHLRLLDADAQAAD